MQPEVDSEIRTEDRCGNSLRKEVEQMKALNIKVFKDGEEFCALAGPDTTNGVSGYGESEADALTAWVREWESMNRIEQDAFRDEYGEAA
jgi:hypothetical protein